MKYRVYHVIEPTFPLDPPDPIDFPKGFELVAEVETDGHLEAVFQLTNHIECDKWWKNEEVTLVKTSRSTPVGDVVMDEENRCHLCDSVGWRQFFISDISLLTVLVEEFIRKAPAFEGDGILASSIGKTIANLQSKEMKKK